MDEIIFETPQLPEEEALLVNEASKVYFEHFDEGAFIGRCIFLSFYCSVNSCDFCFRSIADNKNLDPQKARRSLGSILTEALLIKAFNWRIEFLTGGYNMYPKEETARYAKLVSSILGEKIWLNLGILPSAQMKSMSESVEGIVASVETLEEELHKKTCPDKPLSPYERMLEQAKELGFKRSITLVIGLGEDKSHWKIVESFVSKHSLQRITLYALRPLKGTPYTKGPSTAEMVWWIAKMRITFPKIEIVVGTAEYRIPEISLLLRAGANGFTKLPVTKLFNTDDAKKIEDEVVKASRKWSGVLCHKNPIEAMDWEAEIDRLELTLEEKEEVRRTLYDYLANMKKRLSTSVSLKVLN